MAKTLQQIVVVRGRTKVVLVELYIVPSVTLWAVPDIRCGLHGGPLGELSYLSIFNVE
jgi:hypothetical protein